MQRFLCNNGTLPATASPTLAVSRARQLPIPPPATPTRKAKILVKTSSPWGKPEDGDNLGALVRVENTKRCNAQRYRFLCTCIGHFWVALSTEEKARSRGIGTHGQTRSYRSVRLQFRMYRAKGKSRLRSPTVRWEHSHPPKLQDFRRELLPNPLAPATSLQGWENIDHSVHDSFEVGAIEVERNRMDIQTREGAPRAQT
jgi:hypothetical protein